MPRTKCFKEEEVLKKAMELFWKKGYHATSIQDLVDFLGINRASLYDTFGGKKALFEKAFALYRDTNTHLTRQFLAKEANTKEGFLKLFTIAVQQIIEDKDNKGCFVVNTTTEMLPLDKSLKKTLSANKATFEDIFYQYLQKGEQEGQIKKGKNLKAIAQMLFTVYNGLKVVGKTQQKEEALMPAVHAALSVLD